ncbi:hypothetical protein [Christiangramia sp.]|uniref:hypothetical protein n=1 Tax=Christiangramia sp. TaxID=1931228 RepID=UPI00260A9CDB|nr:hypothetical protein [Christiangramia sp.]
MKSQDSLHVVKCLNRLKERYELSQQELLELKRIKNCIITSIAFTENGGFDRENGEFHEEEREFSYKIRIKYRVDDLDEEKILVMVPIQEIPDQLVS